MKASVNRSYVSSNGKLRKLAFFNVTFVMLALNFCAGCVHLVSDYDIHTYRGLTELKGEMKVVFERFEKNGASGEDDRKKLRTFLVKMSQALEYEKGKNLNDDTISQFKILDQTVREIVERFESNENKLSAGYAKAKWMILENAFDIAIETENNKINKTKGG